MTSPNPLSRSKRIVVVVALLALMAGAGYMLKPPGNKAAPASMAATSTRPALTVNLITPQTANWPRELAANGFIAAWQEAVIGAEISNDRLTEVLVNVGDRVKKGQVLARIASDTAAADLAQSKASVAEAEAMLAEAKANADRARQFQATGFMSAQQINQYFTTEKTALAKLNAARARMQADELHLAKTVVRSSDDGVISSRAATVGSLTQPGQELFRLIRGGRLEWRAEVSASDLGNIKPGLDAVLTVADGARLQGKVRMVAPTVDTKTLNGLVYVDLPVTETGATIRAGIYARGAFELGASPAMSLPQSAVLLRDGFAYVFRLEGSDKVAQTKVAVGRRSGDLVEITGGITPDTRVVASGAGFLADGDSVKVVSPITP